MTRPLHISRQGKTLVAFAAALFLMVGTSNVIQYRSNQDRIRADNRQEACSRTLAENLPQRSKPAAVISQSTLDMIRVLVTDIRQLQQTVGAFATLTREAAQRGATRTELERLDSEIKKNDEILAQKEAQLNAAVIERDKHPLPTLKDCE